MSRRCAVYFSPGDDTPLSRYGERVLGRSATSLSVTENSSLRSAPSPCDHLSSEARRYGFHATLKAPFELASGCSLEELCMAVQGLAEFTAPIPLIGLSPRALRGFLALTLPAQPAALRQLADRCVVELDPYRAPLTEADRLRRRPDRLSAREREHLERYGYPYILDAFQFHMTLASGVDASCLHWLATQYDTLVPTTPVLDRLSIFEQQDRQQPFFRIREFFLAAAAP